MKRPKKVPKDIWDKMSLLDHWWVKFTLGAACGAGAVIAANRLRHSRRALPPGKTSKKSPKKTS